MSDKNSQNRDQRLARKYGDVLEKKRSHPSITDPLFDQLLQYRHDKNGELSKRIELSGKNQIWDNIEHKINSGSQKKTQSSRGKALYSSFRKVASIAASLLVVCFAGLYYYLAQPVLIKKAGADVAEINLSDGSNVTLRPNSKIYKKGIWALSDYRYELMGEGFFQVVEQSETEFSVKAGNGAVRVMGTAFNLSAWGNTTRVFLQEGEVKVEDISSNESVTLKPEQSAVVSTGGKIDKQTSVDVSEYTDWMQQKLIFKNRTVQYVFSELEQQFNITILTTQKIAATRLSGELSIKNLTDALNDLEIVLDGSFVKVDNESNTNTFRFEANN